MITSFQHFAAGVVLAEAHVAPDTPLVTATSFAGFLLPLVIAAI
ncbi:MAG TPA: hypothetical protein VGA65_00810 [Hyphomicrobium sp.]|jgi:hypothetical protein